MPIFKLKKNFPQVLVLPGDYKSYAKYSHDMFEIVRRYADDVEEYSIDECFADLTGFDRPLRMSYREIAERIKNEIVRELGLSVSIGIAPTKVLAKVASKWQKPNGLTVITKESAHEYLKNTSIEKIWGIGRSTSEFLKRKGFANALDFAQKDITWVREHLSKPFETLWLELNGIFVMKINGEQKTTYASVQKTRSFHPSTNDKVFLLSQFSKHTEEACRKARHYNLVAKKISFFLKTKDFKYFTFSLNLPTPSNSPEVLIPLIRKNIRIIWKGGVLYRTTGVTLHELCSDKVVQGDLFGATERENKFETIHKQIDSLEEKFGKRVVHLGSTHDVLKNKVKGTDADDLDRNLLFL
jgi:DNA polymerase-4/DNA polymerase V